MSHDSKNSQNSKVLIGSLTTFLRNASKINAANPDTHTPCGSCDTCCRTVFNRISLTPEEQVRFGVEYFDMTGEGRCPYLGDKGCEIYQQRPLSCHTFDCRYLTTYEVAREEIGGIPPLPASHLHELAEKWVFKPLSNEDKLALKTWVGAINWAAVSMQKQEMGVDVMPVIGKALEKYPELLKAAKKHNKKG